MALIRAKALSVGYNNRAVAANIDFEVNKGDFLCVIGENGSGKSTLVKTLLHLQPPVSGEIITEDRLDRGSIGYLPQQTDVQKDFPASVWEVVLSGCQGKCGLRPFYSKGEKKIASEKIARMGISDLKDRCYRELSGGQQQRVLLARALCAADKILLLDEPVTGLDPMATQELYGLIRELNEESITILMVSHDIDTAIAYTTHVLHMGKEVYFGEKHRYLNSEPGKTFLGETGGAV